MNLLCKIAFITILLSSICITPVVGDDTVSEMANIIYICEEGWEYKEDSPQERCQSPEISLNKAFNNFVISSWLKENGNTPENIKRLNNAGYRIEDCGDCDDFAVMMAAVIQEFYHFDTCVALHNQNPKKTIGHAICLVKLEPSGRDTAKALLGGSGYTHVDNQGRYWFALDMKENGGLFRYPPNYWNTCADLYEWYELVGIII